MLSYRGIISFSLFMAESLNSTPQGGTTAPLPNQNPSHPLSQTEFLKGTDTADRDMLYTDLFQKNADGDFVRTTKTERSKLELFTTIMGFVTPIIVIIALLAGGHAFLKSQTSNTFAENYPFLCGYLNADIIASEDKGCKTASILETEYSEKTKQLQANIVNNLATYIPIKISSSSGGVSPETDLITHIYNSKINLNTIMKQFDQVRSSSQSTGFNNIDCKSLNITQGNTLTVQCDIYGGVIGAVDSINSLGSSRLEATRFIERIANTPESGFILETPPTTLSVENIAQNTDTPSLYKTKTSVTLSLKYFPFSPQL